MVNEATAYGTGQLPDKEGQMYHVTVDNFYLIPTAEVAGYEYSPRRDREGGGAHQDDRLYPLLPP